MFNKNSQKREELDGAGRLILQAAVADDADVEAAASAPFLFTRIRAAIAAEQRQQEESAWLPLILVARRVIPAMALMALLAAVLTFWPSTKPGRLAAADEEVLFGPAEPGVEQTVLASRNGLSRDEVFNIVVDRNFGANGK
jgi:hypothetical protein